MVLAEVVPPVVRVIDVPASSSLPELHQLLQAAMGWTDSHLHKFQRLGAYFTAPPRSVKRGWVSSR